MLLFKTWGEECVVYNTLSGDTHLLPILHARTLQLINKKKDGDDLINHLMGEYGIHRENAIEQLNALHDTFSSLGLIDPLTIRPNLQ